LSTSIFSKKRVLTVCQTTTYGQRKGLEIRVSAVQEKQYEKVAFICDANPHSSNSIVPNCGLI